MMSNNNNSSSLDDIVSAIDEAFVDAMIDH